MTDEKPIALPGAPGRNTGHGHVFPRPDGARARCGGPALCGSCRADAARKADLEARRPPAVAPLDAVSGTCDWGSCNGVTTALRWSADGAVWLPVCVVHELEGAGR